MLTCNREALVARLPVRVPCPRGLLEPPAPPPLPEVPELVALELGLALVVLPHPVAIAIVTTRAIASWVEGRLTARICPTPHPRLSGQDFVGVEVQE